ncbi:hypothetical protein BgAZ_209580 [Babesia gibsoni]|uniref:Signal peptide containing protein n=1 Tax=Babesia gibsoni TaxID=33632 RepID=A0AAD8PEV7_BABGI|nr:hypothetical protein BgAZ_209580 [Babesia gibsoni]
MEKVRLLIWSVFLCLFPVIAPNVDETLNRPLGTPPLLTRSKLSGDYAGLPIEFDVELSEEGSTEHIVSVTSLDKNLKHSQRVVNAKPGFAITKIKAAGVLIWKSDTYHAENITVNIFADERYLKWNVNFGDTFVEAKHYKSAGEGWRELSYKNYISQIFSRLHHDTIDINDTGATLKRHFTSVLKGWGKSYNNGYMPMSDHIFTKVTFNERILWEYDPEEPLECVRVDRIKVGQTILVFLHFLRLDGTYKVITMYGDGPRTMSISNYDDILQEVMRFPPVEIAGRTLDSQKVDPKKSMIVDIKDGNSQKIPIIHVVEDGCVPEVMKQKNVKKASTLDLHADGLITLDLFNNMDNPNVDTIDITGDRIDVGRSIFVPRKGNLIGRIIDKAMNVMYCRNIFVFKVAVDHGEGFKVMQVFSTNANGRVLKRYFIKGSDNRMGEMTKIYLDIDHIQQKNKLLVMNETSSGTWSTKKGNAPPIFTAFPAFKTFISQILQGETVLWEFDKEAYRYLVSLKMWQHDSNRIMSIETLDAKDRRYEIVYILNGNLWTVAEKGSNIKAYKQGVTIDISQLKANDKIRIIGGSLTSNDSLCEIEVVEGYYIKEVLYGNSILWSAERTELHCGKIYTKQFPRFMIIALEMYDGDGHMYYFYFIKGKKESIFQADVVLSSLITRKLADNDEAFKLLI